jgi:hypothetical protein
MPVLVAALIGAVLFGGVTWLWLQRPQAASQIDPSRPRFQGYFDGQPRLASLQNGSSVLIFKVVVTNSGAESIARDWSVHLGRGGIAGLERLRLINPEVGNLEFEVPGNPAGLVIASQELIQRKTGTTPIAPGHAVAGIVVTQAPTLTVEAFREAEVVVTFRDVLGVEYAMRRKLGMRKSP